TCVLFGDGAGALVLKSVSDSAPTDSSSSGRFILSTHLHSDGRQYDILYVDGGPSSTRATGFLRMQGREVFRQAVQHLSEVIDETLHANNLTGADIDCLFRIKPTAASSVPWGQNSDWRRTRSS